MASWSTGAVMLCAVIVLGCQGSSAPEPPAPKVASAPTPVAHPTVDFVGLVVDWATIDPWKHWMTRNRKVPRGMAGVRVCLHEHPEVACVHSAEDGRYTLKGLPTESMLVLTLSKDGYQPLALPAITDRLDLKPVPDVLFTLMNKPEALKVALSPDVVLDETLGGIRLVVNKPGDGGMFAGVFAALEGTRFELEPQGATPHYSDASGTWVKEMGAEVRVTHYINLTPGEYQVTVRPPEGYYCGPGGGDAWPISGYPSETEALRVPVVAGHVTQSGFYCVP